jgi:hypothetical protein
MFQNKPTNPSGTLDFNIALNDASGNSLGCAYTGGQYTGSMVVNDACTVSSSQINIVLS